MCPIRVELAVERSVRVGAESDQRRHAVLVGLVRVHDGHARAARCDEHLADAAQPLPPHQVEPPLEERTQVGRGCRLALPAVPEVGLLVDEQRRVLRCVDDDSRHPAPLRDTG